MPKTLLLMRHGKSDWAAEAEDFDRPLNKRGRDTATLMGQYLEQEELLPEAIYTSPAKRALSTAELVQAELTDVELVEEERIYGAELEELLAVVNGLPDDYECVLLIGHNPIMEELADELSGRNDSVMKTASLAILKSKVKSWSEVQPESCKLVDIVNPAEVAD